MYKFMCVVSSDCLFENFIALILTRISVDCLFTLQKIKYLCNFAVPCPTPFIRLAGGCYNFQNVSVTWSEARVSCQEIGGDLAIVDDCTAMAPIINHIQGLGDDCFLKLLININGAFLL